MVEKKGKNEKEDSRLSERLFSPLHLIGVGVVAILFTAVFVHYLLPGNPTGRVVYTPGGTTGEEVIGLEEAEEVALVSAKEMVSAELSGIEVEVDGVEEDGAFYRVELSMTAPGGQTNNMYAYMTKDGNYFLPSVFDVESGELMAYAPGETEEEPVPETPVEEEEVNLTEEPVVKVLVLNDERCENCDVSGLLTNLGNQFPKMEVEEIDYSTTEGKSLYAETNVTFLPAIFFTESVEGSSNYASIKGYLSEAGNYQLLAIGSKFDPTKEICDNGVDDTGNGKIDCEDESCSGEYACSKMEVPKVELFVMSHCPYGTQTEKAFLPVVELLGDKIDFSVKFCDYAMHGKKELDEQMLETCIQKEQEDKYLDYLTCFLNASDSEACVAQAGIDEERLNSCVSELDEEYKITEMYEDKSTWRSGAFPVFPVFEEEVQEYNIRGSPGLAINNVRIESFQRNPDAVLDLICQGFEEMPAECNQTLSTATPSAGFGFSESTTASTGTCG